MEEGMSIKEMAEAIGRLASWNPAADAALSVDVRIQDVRRAYGRTDYLITPVAGTGETWVTATTVQMQEQA
jgi:hypothetical protein